MVGRIGKILLLFLLITYPFGVEAFYLKIEAPVYIHLDELQQSASFLRSKGTSWYGIGIGYQLSSFLDMQVTYSKIGYRIDGYEQVSGVGLAGDPLVLEYKMWSAIALPTTVLGRPYCSRDLRLAKTAEQICPPRKKCAHASNIAAASDVFITSIKLKLPRKVGRFTPYFSVGAGFNFQKTTDLQYPETWGNELIKRITTITRSTSLAMEGGVGVDVNILKNVDLGIGIKYFDYGEQELTKGVGQRMRGYNVMASLILNF